MPGSKRAWFSSLYLRFQHYEYRKKIRCVAASAWDPWHGSPCPMPARTVVNFKDITYAILLEGVRESLLVVVRPPAVLGLVSSTAVDAPASLAKAAQE